jgi:hypothetical protein
MIRVNLLKNKVGDQTTIQAGGTSESGNDVRDTAVKIVFILIFTLGLMVY